MQIVFDVLTRITSFGIGFTVRISWTLNLELW